ncbi:MAG: hypothetical protein ACP5KN_17825, partial [Armatimonadota bacterium]
MRQYLLILVLPILLAAVAGADETMRLDFDADPGFEPQPSWVPTPSDGAAVTVADGVARFEVPEPETGMKWRISLERSADIGLYPWLVIRYRAGNYAVDRADYLVWLSTDAAGDGIRLFRGEIEADGAWHTAAVNVLEVGEGATAYQLAVQVQSAAEGDGWLEIDSIALVDAPPEGATLHEPQPGPDRVWEVPVQDPGAFTAEPDWLSNPAEEPAVQRTEHGLRFSVPEAGRGMKWSFEPPEPVEGARWLAVRYRAERVQRRQDYFIYLANAGGGSAPEEQYCLSLADVHSTGSWQVAVGQVEVQTIRAMALQVQAEAPDAFVEVASIRFSRHRPPRMIADTLEIGPPEEDFRALALPDGERSAQEICRLLGYDDALPAGPLRVEGVSFDVAARPPMTQMVGDDALTVPVGEQASEVYLLLGLRAPRVEEESYGGGALSSVTQPHRFQVRLAYGDARPDDVFPVSLHTGEFEIERGLGVYLLAPDADRTLERVVVRDTMDRGSLAVLGATMVLASEARRPELHPRRAAPPLAPTMRDVPAGTPEITVDGDRVMVAGPRLRVQLDAARQMAITMLGSDFIGGAPFDVEPRPLFALIVNAEEVPAAALELRFCEVDEAGVLRAEYVCAEPAVTVAGTLRPREDGSVVIGLSARNDGQERADIELHGPRIGAIEPRAGDEGLAYLFPSCGAAISDEPVA